MKQLLLDFGGCGTYLPRGLFYPKMEQQFKASKILASLCLLICILISSMLQKSTKGNLFVKAQLNSSIYKYNLL